MRFIVISFILIFSATCFAAESKEALIKRHYDFIATEAGKKYEMIAVGTFWGAASFMQKCAPRDAPVPEPFEILYIVKSDGSVRDIYLYPETNVGLCVKSNVKTRIFNNPPSEFVGYIKMSFTQ